MTEAGGAGEGTQSAKALPPDNSAMNNAISQRLVMCASTRRRGVATKRNEQPHTKPSSNASQSTMWGKDQEGEPLPITSDGQRALPNARRQITRRSEGQSQGMEARTLLARNPTGEATAKRLPESREAHDRRHLTQAECVGP